MMEWLLAEGFVAFMELGKPLLKQDRCKQSCSNLDLAGSTYFAVDPQNLFHRNHWTPWISSWKLDAKLWCTLRQTLEICNTCKKEISGIGVYDCCCTLPCVVASLSVCVSKGLHIHDLWSCMCASTLFSLQPVIFLCNVIRDCTSDNRILILGSSTYLWKCHISANNDASWLQQAWNFRELLVICRQRVLRLHVREI
jgi:hypothetical protein